MDSRRTKNKQDNEENVKDLKGFRWGVDSAGKCSRKVREVSAEIFNLLAGQCSQRLRTGEKEKKHG